MLPLQKYKKKFIFAAIELGLSPTEIRYMWLAANGWTSKQIGSKYGITGNGVSALIGNANRFKVGASSRTQTVATIMMLILDRAKEWE